MRKKTQDAVGITRRGFLQILGSGLLFSVVDLWPVAASGRSEKSISARIHVGQDGSITVMTGKVELGQGARAQITLAAAEEMRVSPEAITLIMADTDLVPDDGVTAGSRTTPSTIVAVRKGTATARECLIALACSHWQVGRDAVVAKDGVISRKDTDQRMTYGDLAKVVDVDKAFESEIPDDVEVTPVTEWQVMGHAFARPNSRDLVTGAHRFPSDTVRPGMLYGKILRPPSYGAALTSVDLSQAQAMPGVVVVREGDFVGCAAPTSFLAWQSMDLVAKTAQWQTVGQPSQEDLFALLKAKAQEEPGEVDKTPEARWGNVSQVVEAAYQVPYVQHVPLEPRSAVAEWSQGKLTVWTGTQAPFRNREELAKELGLPPEDVRVIAPDTGGAFGGKQSPEAALEASRLAKACGQPVCVRWSRQEEFTWAYFRPAALIEIKAGLDSEGRLVGWDYTNINSGESAIRSPYDIPRQKTRYLRSESPLRQGSYRALAATANNFAREAFMDELALAAGKDPHQFRMEHLREQRLKDVLEAAVEASNFHKRRKKKQEGTGWGLACGTEKGSYVAACVEIEVDPQSREVKVVQVFEAFECGAIQNPSNLLSQVQGCILMGMGPALFERIEFADGKILNASFQTYQVPRFRDVPEIHVELLNRQDLASVGAGETPILAIAPAIVNAVFDATGVRMRALPVRVSS